MTDYMFKSYAETSVGEYYLDPTALADVAGYPSEEQVLDEVFYGVEGTEYEGSLDVTAAQVVTSTETVVNSA